MAARNNHLGDYDWCNKTEISPSFQPGSYSTPILAPPYPQGGVQQEPTILGHQESQTSAAQTSNGQPTFPATKVEVNFTQSIAHAISCANFKVTNPNQFPLPPYPVQSTGADGGNTLSASTTSPQFTTTEPVMLGANEHSLRNTHLYTPATQQFQAPHYALTPPSLPPDLFLSKIYFAINSFSVYYVTDLSRIGFVYSAKTLFDEGRRLYLANQEHYLLYYRGPLNMLANLLEAYFPYQFSRMEYWYIL
jgi:hypothetical protein